MCLLEGEKEITSDNDILSEVIYGQLWTNTINLYSNPYLYSFFILLPLKFNYSPPKGNFKILWVFPL